MLGMTQELGASQWRYWEPLQKPCLWKHCKRSLACPVLESPPPSRPFPPQEEEARRGAGEGSTGSGEEGERTDYGLSVVS